MLLMLVAFIGCSKDEEGGTDFRPEFYLQEATDVTRTGATLQGMVDGMNMGGVIDVGFMYSESSTMGTNDVATKRVKGTMDGNGMYRAVLTGLEPGKTYYYCLYATKGSSILKSEIKSFATSASCAPVLDVITVMEKGETTFRLSCAIIDVGGDDEDLQQFGFAYKEETAEGEFKRFPASGFKNEGLKTFEVLLEGLQPETLYRIYPFATNRLQGEGRGDTITLSTSVLVSATVTTQEIPVADIGAAWVNAVGTLEAIGNGTFVGCGFLLSENGAEETMVASELIDRTFAKKIIDLKANTSYTVRAYVETLVSGTTKRGYGIKRSFTTLAISTPLVSAASYTINDAKTSMTVAAEVNSAGNGTVSSTGFYYSTTNKVPNQEDTHLQGTLTGTTFNAVIDGLVPNATYYIRSFARNEAGMGFGTVATVTPNQVAAPGVNGVGYAMTGTTLTLTSGVSSDTGSEIKERGFLWSTTSQIVSDMTKLVASGNNETFTAQLPEIPVDVVYYVCAYAENALGLIGYSNVREITPLATKIPSVGEVTATVNSDGSMTLSSLVTDAHLGTTAAYGFYYSTTGDPSEADTHVPATGNDGKFTGTIPKESLKPNTYRIRAYAENQKGKGWGSVRSITIAIPSVRGVTATCKTVASVSTLTLSSAVENAGGAPIAERGFYWSTTPKAVSEVAQMTKLVATTGNDEAFTAQIPNVEADATYYIYAYAQNSVDLIGYSARKDEKPLTIIAPEVGQVTLKLESDGSITLSSLVTNMHFGTISEYGFYYADKHSNPMDQDAVVKATGNDSKFVGTIPKGTLQTGVTYHIRAYARNEKEEGRGPVGSFIPLVSPQLGGVTAVRKADDSGGTYTYTLSSNVQNTWGVSIVERGFYWSTTSKEIAELKKQKLVATGNDAFFEAQIPNLQAGATYYICSYAKNSIDIEGYSAVRTEIPLPISVPTVGGVTSKLEDDGSLTLSSLVTNANFGTTSKRGFYYNTTGDPSDNDKLVESTGDDSKFVGTISKENLKPDVTYYIRAYAENQAAGKGWGNTLGVMPIKLPKFDYYGVREESKTGTSIVVSASVVSDGTDVVTEKGFCYSASDKSPVIGKEECVSVKDETSTDKGIRAVLGNLSYKTPYYIRAYAKNKYGVAYSTTKQVTTKGKPGGEDIEDPSKQN